MCVIGQRVRASVSVCVWPVCVTVCVLCVGVSVCGVIECVCVRYRKRERVCVTERLRLGERV